MSGSDLSDFFNPHDLSHIKALEHFLIFHQWPDGFLPDSIDTTTMGSEMIQILAKIRDTWVEHLLTVHDNTGVAAHRDEIDAVSQYLGVPIVYKNEAVILTYDNFIKFIKVLYSHGVT
jgi:hypothetical protein